MRLSVSILGLTQHLSKKRASGHRHYSINVTYDFNSVRFFSGSYTFGINMSVRDILVIGVYVGLDRAITGGERIHAERTGVYSQFFARIELGF